MRVFLLLLSALLAAPTVAQERPLETKPLPAAPKKEHGDAPKSSLNLVIDYLPAVLYQGSDPFTVVGRVENASAAPREITVTAAPSGNEGIAPSTKTETVAPGKFLRFEHTFRTGAYKSVSLTVTSGNDTITRTVQMIDPKEDVPEGVKATGGWLSLGVDHFVILRIEKRIYKKNETWRLARYIYQAVSNDDMPGHVLLYGHPLAADTGDANGAVGVMGKPIADAASSLTVKFDRHPVLIGRHEYTYPVLKMLAHLNQAVSSANKDGGAVLLLSPADPQLATPRRLYKLAIEAILDRMENAGITRVLVVGPTTKGVPANGLLESEEPAADGLKTAADLILKRLQ